MKQRSEKRQQYIISKYENTCMLMEDLANRSNTSFSALMDISKLRGGSFSSSLADARNLGFVSNGKGFSLTQTGRDYLKTKSQAILKRQVLMLPFFAKIYETLGEDASYNIIRQWIEKNKGDLFLSQFVGSVASRYFEAIRGYTPKKEVIQRQIVLKPEHLPPIKLKDILLDKGLTKQEIIQMIECVKDTEKRQKLWEELI